MITKFSHWERTNFLTQDSKGEYSDYAVSTKYKILLTAMGQDPQKIIKSADNIEKTVFAI